MNGSLWKRLVMKQFCVSVAVRTLIRRYPWPLHPRLNLRWRSEQSQRPRSLPASQQRPWTESGCMDRRGRRHQPPPGWTKYPPSGTPWDRNVRLPVSVLRPDTNLSSSHRTTSTLCNYIHFKKHFKFSFFEKNPKKLFWGVYFLQEKSHTTSSWEWNQRAFLKRVKKRSTLDSFMKMTNAVRRQNILLTKWASCVPSSARVSYVRWSDRPESVSPPHAVDCNRNRREGSRPVLAIRLIAVRSLLSYGPSQRPRILVPPRPLRPAYLFR